MQTGGPPSMSSMADSTMAGDSMMKGFASLGDQGDAMNMASSGNVVPFANPSPSNGLNAQPTMGQIGPVAGTMLPTAQTATRLTPDQVQRILAYYRSKSNLG